MNWCFEDSPNQPAAVHGQHRVQARAALRDRAAASSPDVVTLGTDLVETIRQTGRPARVTVSRQAPQDVGFREIYVSLDGEEIALLQHGESVSREVQPGEHRLRVHNTLFRKTHEFVLRAGEHARFVTANTAGWGTYGMLMTLGVGILYISLERDQAPN